MRKQNSISLLYYLYLPVSQSLFEDFMVENSERFSSCNGLTSLADKHRLITEKRSDSIDNAKEKKSSRVPEASSVRLLVLETTLGSKEVLVDGFLSEGQ